VTLVSFFEKAFSVLFRLPELWLETWWRILRRPLKAPLLLAFSTRRSFDLALSGPIFYLINIVLLFILLSTFSEGLTRFANLQSANIDVRTFFNLEDVNSIRVLVLSIVFTSAATFFFIMLARGLGIGPKLPRLLSATLIYYLSVQVMITLVLLLSLYSLSLLKLSIDYTSALILIAILLAVALSASLLIWILGALMLVRASPWNTIRGWRRVILRSAVTSALILIFIGLYMLIRQINIEAPIQKTVYIVDGECNLEHDGLYVKSVVHNGSTIMYKIEAISVRVGPRLGGQRARSILSSIQRI
jgi:hypothetical protein